MTDRRFLLFNGVRLEISLRPQLQALTVFLEITAIPVICARVRVPASILLSMFETLHKIKKVQYSSGHSFPDF